MKRTSLILIIGLILCPGFRSVSGQEKIIFDTDFDSDIDDVGALYLLHTLADRGEVDILATVLSTTHFWSPFALDAVNTYWGRPDIPIGAPFIDGVDKGSVYAEAIASRFPNDLGETLEVEESARLYRRILAAQPDGSVTLVSVGHLTNVARLLESEADEFSPLSGQELIRRKVKKWVAMLGEGMNWNMKWDRRASETAINNFPVPIVFTVDGQEVKTGAGTRDLEDENPIKTVYALWEKHYGEIDRSSWDQISTLYAVRGEGDYFRVKQGALEFSMERGSVWKDKAGGKDLRLSNRVSNEELAAAIEELMLRTPATSLKCLQPGERPFSLLFQRDLLDLHQLNSYKAGKNSFVLGLETICRRPPMLGEYGRKTILDLEGTGSLRHIWEYHGPDKCPFIMEFYVDGEEEPSISGPLDELVRAAMDFDQPYAAPGGSCRDFDSHNFYIPVPFEKSLRVDLVANPRIGLVFLQLDYRLEDESMKGIKLVQVKDRDGRTGGFRYASSSEIPAHPVASLPQTLTRRWRFSGDTVLSVKGPALIRRLALNSARDGVELKIRYEGEKSNAVKVDLADFFGPFRGLAMNNNQCYFPMPFEASAEIEISGSSPHEEWELEMDLEGVERFEPGWGYFHAIHNRVDSSLCYQPFQVLSTSGRGHWVGMSIYDTHHDHGGGDFAVIDAQSAEPSFLHGINGEDYFSFALFGKGENFPYSEAFDNDRGRMRIHFENPYPFKESIAVNWGVTGGLQPRSTAFWYQDTPVDLTLTPGEARGRLWSVFGPVTVTALEKDGNTPDVSDLDRLFEVLPEEPDLDRGLPADAEHLIFDREIRATFSGWKTQYAEGPFLNLMYVYGHVMDDLGGNHHMGYYARAMMAKTEIRRDVAGEVRLRLSYDDPLQLYLNGEQVFSDNTLRSGFTTRTLRVNLKQGPNTLLVKMLDTPNINTMWAGIALEILEP